MARWSRETGHTHSHSNVYFGDSIATFYQRNIEAKFFNHFLKGKMAIKILVYQKLTCTIPAKKNGRNLPNGRL